MSIINEINTIKTQDCRKNSKEYTCKITEENIKNISTFISHIIPSCGDTGITLDSIRNGKILGRGSFGYSFLAGDKIIKIIVCNDTMKKSKFEELEFEINNHKDITQLDDNDCFIKLYGYFKKNNNNQYEYIDSKTNEIKCLFDIKNIENIDKMCEIYLIMEAGKMDLYNYYFNNKNDKNYLVRSFNNLLKFYKLSLNSAELYNKIFIHSDIKMENIVIMNDNSLRLIDFGVSGFHNNFFKKYQGGTPYFFKLLFNVDYNNRDYWIISPLFDIFSILITFFEILLNIPYKNINFDTIRNNILNNFNKFQNIHKKYFYLMDSIYNYHQNILKTVNEKYLETNVKNEKDIINKYKLKFKIKKDNDETNKFIKLKYINDFYYNLFDFKDFKLSYELITLIKEENNNKNIPIYNIPVYNTTKLQTDIRYLDDIMKFVFDFDS